MVSIVNNSQTKAPRHTFVWGSQKKDLTSTSEDSLSIATNTRTSHTSIHTPILVAYRWRVCYSQRNVTPPFYAHEHSYIPLLV